MNVAAGEIVVKIVGHVIPAMFIDRGHQTGQKRNGSHIARILTRTSSSAPQGKRTAITT
jgi:hypothetical protein